MTGLVTAAVLATLVAFLISTAEAAFSRMSRTRANELLEEGRPGSTALVKVVGDTAAYLSVLSFLRVIAESTVAVMITLAVVDRVEGTWQPFLVAIAIMALISFAVVGVSPGTLGAQHSSRVALAAAPTTVWLRRLLGPFSRLLIALTNAVTPGKGFRDGPFESESELRDLVDMARDSALIEAGEREMIHSVFELGDTLAREVMVPRTDMVSIDDDRVCRQAMTLFLRSGFSRIPVLGKDVDDVVGLLYLKDVIRRLNADPEAGAVPVRELMRPMPFVPESKPVDDLLREMQRDQTHFAVVVDEYGGTAGLVTIEDILEEIVGEITDEYDREAPEVEDLGDGRLRVAATLHVDDLAELFDIDARGRRGRHRRRADRQDHRPGAHPRLDLRGGRVAPDRRTDVGSPAPDRDRGRRAGRAGAWRAGDGGASRMSEHGSGYVAGFACLIGRPNAGKSTLTNALVGSKVAITSSKPQTTRHTIRGIVTGPTSQLILVDTPGLHKPRTLLGQRLNDLVRETLLEVDVIGFCLPADQRIGPGDQFIARELAELKRGKSTPVVALATKSDKVDRKRMAEHLIAIDQLGDWAAIVPCSATRGDQVEEVAAVLAEHLPPSPGPLYPDDVLTDEPELVMIAELVREAALEGVRDELPHSLAVVVEEIVPREGRSEGKPLLDVRVNVFVERDSQKAIVIGRGGSRLREVGTNARAGIEELLGQRVHLDLHVKVAKDWQRDPKQLGRLGF